MIGLLFFLMVAAILIACYFYLKKALAAPAPRAARPAPEEAPESPPLAPRAARPAPEEAPESPPPAPRAARPDPAEVPKLVAHCGQATHDVVDVIQAFYDFCLQVRKMTSRNLLERLWSGEDGLHDEWYVTMHQFFDVQREAAAIEALRTVRQWPVDQPQELPEPLRAWTARLDRDCDWYALALEWLLRKGPVLQTIIEALPIEASLGVVEGNAVDFASLKEYSDRMHTLFAALAETGGCAYEPVRLYEASVESYVQRVRDERFEYYRSLDPVLQKLDHHTPYVVRVSRPILRLKDKRAGRGARKARLLFAPPLASS